jgi:hypothetical protein
MRKARCEVIDPGEVNVVHVHNRTVRRCFLFGQDELTGKNFDHRKVWIEDCLKHFAAHFGIDLLTYAVMSNHFHLILRNRPDVVATWDDTEVARRWLMICPHRKDESGRPLPPTEAELNLIRRCPLRLQQIRKRLADVSWWMRLMCQKIATRSNQEDGASGHFFEERYRAVRLVDDASVLACSAYVDLNPIRAAICQTIETSEHTSVKIRIDAMRQSDLPRCQTGSAKRPRVVPIRPRIDAFLSPLSIDERTDSAGPVASADSDRCSDKGFLPMSVLDYVELLDWTARQVAAGKPGKTPSSAPPVVKRLAASGEAWCELVGSFGRLFHHVAGSPETINALRSHKTGSRFRVHRRVRELMPTSDC